MKKWLFILMILSTSFAFAAATGSENPENGREKKIAEFFLLLQKDQVDEAYASLTKDSKISEDLDTLKTKTQEAIKLFGKFKGSELLETKIVGQHLCRLTYISLGEHYPLRWRFYFYKNEKGWTLIDIGVDDRLTQLFEEPEEDDL